jgi:hypothetical protein
LKDSALGSKMGQTKKIRQIIIWPILEVRAEIFQKFGLIFGDLKTPTFSHWYYLTFSDITIKKLRWIYIWHLF